MIDEKAIWQERHRELTEAKFKKGMYVHANGGLYVAYSTTCDEVTGQVLVHYYSVERKTRWTRTLEVFLGRFAFRYEVTVYQLREAAGVG